MTKNRRWYDKDPFLSEAMEILSLSTDDKKSEAAAFIINLQNEAAAEVIEHVHETVLKYSGKGNRWYDNDPVMLRAIELLRTAPPDVQRNAARKLLKSLLRRQDEQAGS